MYLLKKGVNDTQLKPQMRIALMLIVKIFNIFDKTLTVTSTYEGKHNVNSLHYHHLAVDIRIKHLTEPEIHTIYRDITQILKQNSKHYQVILGKTYIHIEYDRRA